MTRILFVGTAALAAALAGSAAAAQAGPAPAAGIPGGAATVLQLLIDDFGFTDFQAAGILGNIGHECLGFTKMQEMRPVGGGRGGYGWCQWTGPRRRAFEAWAREQGLDLDSDAANYGFLKHELETSERATVPAVKTAATIEEAVRAFQVKFERPGVPHPAPRLVWARRALEAFGG
jgi:tail lysozyme